MGRPPGSKRYIREDAKQPAASPAANGKGGNGGGGRSVAQDKETYPRRNPRLGTNFQTKVPSCVGGSSSATDADQDEGGRRPAPDLMSGTHPFRTAEEMDVMNDGVASKTNATGSSPAGTRRTTADEALRGIVVGDGEHGGRVACRISRQNQSSIPMTQTRTGGILTHSAENHVHHHRLPQHVHETFLSSSSSLSAVATTAATTESASSHSSDGGLDPSRQFAKFVQPLFQSFDSQPTRSAHDVTESVQHMIRLHAQATPAKRSRGPRGRKRNVWETQPKSNGIDDLEQVWRQKRRRNLQHHLNQQTGSQEDDSSALAYLCASHGGDATQAELATMVQLLGGKASKTRKLRERRRWDEGIKLPLTSSESWRIRYDNHHESFLGQVQEDGASPRYRAWPTGKAQAGTDSFFMDMESADAEERKGAWRSVHAFGAALEHQLNDESTASQQKPFLSTAMTYIQTARDLPIPESCFGTNHVMVEEVASCMHSILDRIDDLRDARCRILDMLYDEDCEGVDVDALQKCMNQNIKSLPLHLDEEHAITQFCDSVKTWERKVAATLDAKQSTGKGKSSNKTERDDLGNAQRLLAEARMHAFRSKAVVQLESRVEKACKIRDRINEWDIACNISSGNNVNSSNGNSNSNKWSIKNIAGVIREANRLKFMFPVLSKLTQMHRECECWIDRANIAIRSRISLSEIKQLVARGQEMPVDVSDYIEKLVARADDADEWISHLDGVVPVSKFNTQNAKILIWMQEVRKALNDGSHGVLHEMASKGSRIPVEVDLVKLLQAELDARSWTGKARKWIPTEGAEGVVYRRGKIDDLRDHITKADTIRDRLPLPTSIRSKWTMDGEEELCAIIDAADEWYEKHQAFLEGDNRRARRRHRLSITKLKEISQELNDIFVNVGNIGMKVTRIQAQAEAWCNEHSSVLTACGIMPANIAMDSNDGKEKDISSNNNGNKVSVDEISTAVTSAASDLPVDLDEAMELEAILKNVKEWQQTSSILAPLRANKRQGKISRQRFTMQDLEDAIDQAPSLPVNTVEEVGRLQERLHAIAQWKEAVGEQFKKLPRGFDQLREAINDTFGSAHDFDQSKVCTPSDKAATAAATADNMETQDASLKSTRAPETATEAASSAAVTATVTNAENNVNSANGNSSGNTTTDDMETSNGEGDDDDDDGDGAGETNVHSMIRSLVDGSYQTSVTTVESDAIELLENVSNWCIRSLKYLNSPREIFDKRYFGAFDRFVKEGKALLKKSKSSIGNDGKKSGNCNGADNGLATEAFAQETKLRESWGAILDDQLKRLAHLDAERKKFVIWCKVASQRMADVKRLTIERLRDLDTASRDFPAVTDIVQKVRALSVKATAWINKAKSLLESDDKMSIYDAKIILEAGEKLKVKSAELETLQAAFKEVRAWSTRFRKCNLEDDSPDMAEIQSLIAEHDKLKLVMPDELDELKQAMKVYCVCRRSHEGFMIGCDQCDEWYHGACIGITESRADRYEKFVCMRCSVKKVFTTSCTNAVSIVRKWTSWKELKKRRQAEAQRHQRKTRKEMKDIETMKKNLEDAEAQLVALSRRIEMSEGEPNTPQSAGPAEVVVQLAVPPASEPMIVGEPDTGKLTSPPLPPPQTTSAGDAALALVPAQQSNCQVAPQVAQGCHGSATIMTPAEATKGSVQAPDEIQSSPGTAAEAAATANGVASLTTMAPTPAKAAAAPELVGSPTATDPQAVAAAAVDGAVVGGAAPTTTLAPSLTTTTTTSSPSTAAAKAETTASPDKANIQVKVNDAPSAPKTLKELKKEQATLEKKLEKLKKKRADSIKRLADYEKMSEGARAKETDEDKNAAAIRRWCIRVRSLVLIPSSTELVEAARPLQNGTLSGAMLMVMSDSLKLGVSRFADVKMMLNWFKCICWSSMTMSVLTRMPTLAEANRIISLASSLQLPDERALRTLKSIVQRVNYWHQRASKAIAPKGGSTKSINMVLLRQLMTDYSALPIALPDISRFEMAVNDRGARYCICGGPKNGTAMIGCKKCRSLYHANCIESHKGSAVKNAKEWICYGCAGQKMPSMKIPRPDIFPPQDEPDFKFDAAKIDWTMLHAPNPTELWPPFGLFGAEKAVEALGHDASRYPDDIAVLHEKAVTSDESPSIRLSEGSVPLCLVVNPHGNSPQRQQNQQQPTQQQPQQQQQSHIPIAAAAHSVHPTVRVLTPPAATPVLPISVARVAVPRGGALVGAPHAVATQLPVVTSTIVQMTASSSAAAASTIAGAVVATPVPAAVPTVRAASGVVATPPGPTVSAVPTAMPRLQLSATQAQPLHLQMRVAQPPEAVKSDAFTISLATKAAQPIQPPLPTTNQTQGQTIGSTWVQIRSPGNAAPPTLTPPNIAVVNVPASGASPQVVRQTQAAPVDYVKATSALPAPVPATAVAAETAAASRSRHILTAAAPEVHGGAVAAGARVNLKADSEQSSRLATTATQPPTAMEIDTSNGGPVSQGPLVTSPGVAKEDGEVNELAVNPFTAPVDNSIGTVTDIITADKTQPEGTLQHQRQLKPEDSDVYTAQQISNTSTNGDVGLRRPLQSAACPLSDDMPMLTNGCNVVHDQMDVDCREIEPAGTQNPTTPPMDVKCVACKVDDLTEGSIITATGAVTSTTTSSASNDSNDLSVDETESRMNVDNETASHGQYHNQQLAGTTEANGVAGQASVVSLQLPQVLPGVVVATKTNHGI